MKVARFQTESLVIKAGSLLLLASFCLLAVERQSKAVAHASTPQQRAYGAARILGRINSPLIEESSGLVASRTVPGVYWTHNDSGDGPFIYPINSRGRSYGVWRVSGAEATDWEDISTGPGPEPGRSYLYIGDIGDNNSVRKDIVVYRVAEPTPKAADANTTKTRPLLTARAEIFRFRYPDGKHDAETLLVHPDSGDIYIITKVALQNPAVYKGSAPLKSGDVVTLQRTGDLKIPSLFGGIITGGSIAPDGKRAALCDYFQAYEIALPTASKNFDDIWKQRLVSFAFGRRKQGESIAYRLDGRALLGTSEGKFSELIELKKRIGPM